MVGLNGTCFVPGAILILAALADLNELDDGLISLKEAGCLPLKLEVQKVLEPDVVAWFPRLVLVDGVELLELGVLGTPNGTYPLLTNPLKGALPVLVFSDAPCWLLGESAKFLWGA